jgi:hypothetical protein
MHTLNKNWHTRKKNNLQDRSNTIISNTVTVAQSVAIFETHFLSLSVWLKGTETVPNSSQQNEPKSTAAGNISDPRAPIW